MISSRFSKKKKSYGSSYIMSISYFPKPRIALKKIKMYYFDNFQLINPNLFLPFHLQFNFLSPNTVYFHYYILLNYGFICLFVYCTFSLQDS